MEINVFSLLPLVALFANLILGLYILYRNPRDTLSRLYALVVFSLVVWSAANFLAFIASSAEEAAFINKFVSIGSLLAPAFILHFFLVFTRKVKPIKWLYVALLYVPAAIFLVIDFATPLITESAEASYWGYRIIHGAAYIPETMYMVIYAVTGIALCYRFYMKARLDKEKSESLLLMIAISIPVVGGVVTEIILPVLDIVVIPLTSTFTTITAVIIAYAMVKYGLLIITPRMVAERILNTMPDCVIAVDMNDRISFTNRETNEILGYGEEELIGEPFDEIMTPDGMTGFRVSRELGKELKNFETEVMRKDGKMVLVSVNASEIRERKNVVGHVLVLRDIRETTELIRSLKEKTKELERRRRKIRKSKRVFVKDIGRMRIG